MQGATGPLKYTTFDDEPGSTHNLVVGLVPPGAHVLEIGCATGYMSEVLRERLGCTVVGLEIDPAAAADAVGRADRVVVGDAEALDWSEHFAGETFDAIVFADVLEHLRDPAAVLETVRPLLVDGGAVVASVPNIAHISVRLALLGGEFRYRETGLLDETHVRFFTRHSLQDLFEQQGFTVARWVRRRRSLEESEIDVPPAALDERAVALASADSEATTYQFVVRAVPSEHASTLGELRRSVEERQRAFEERERAFDASLRQARTTLAERDVALEEALQALSDARVRLLATDAELRDRDETIDRLGAELDALRGTEDALFAEVAQARAALENRPLVKVSRRLAGRYPGLVEAYRRLRRRVP